MNGVESQNEVQLVPQNLDVVANETYNLSLSDINLTYVAQTDADTIDDIIAGLQSHPDYDATVFTIAKAANGTSIEISLLKWVKLRQPHHFLELRELNWMMSI